MSASRLLRKGRPIPRIPAAPSGGRFRATTPVPRHFLRHQGTAPARTDNLGEPLPSIPVRSTVHRDPEELLVTWTPEALSINLAGRRTFSFHAQWLHDARCDTGPSKSAAAAFCMAPAGIQIAHACPALDPRGRQSVLASWSTGDRTHFPLAWLEAMAPLVAQEIRAAESKTGGDHRKKASGWRVSELQIPEVCWSDIASLDQSPPTAAVGTASRSVDRAELHLSILDHLLHPDGPGIVRIVSAPPPDVALERAKTNTLVTAALKRLFGSVFVHPLRGTDRTFNVSSHHAPDAARGAGLPNYDTSQLLLPHCDHAHYAHPIRVQGWYGLEGISVNTFVSALAALEALRTESPELAAALATAPVVCGRVAPYYDPPMYQASVDAAVTLAPGGRRVRRVRWHPHLAGSLLVPYAEFERARAAHRAYQDVLGRADFQLRVELRPGDLYVWDNHRVLHGRERVLEVPRTGVGQTVPEQVVEDRYRALVIGLVMGRGLIGEEWAVQTPTEVLRRMLG